MSTNAPASSVSQTDAEQDSLMASAILRERIELLHDQLPFLLISSVVASTSPNFSSVMSPLSTGKKVMVVGMVLTPWTDSTKSRRLTKLI